MKIFDNSEDNKKYHEQLLNFVDEQGRLPYPHTVRDLIKKVAIEALLNDEADITGYCKNDALGTAYIELTWRYEK